MIVSLKPRPYQQQCPSSIAECYKFNDSFDDVECCFDIVAVFGNNVAGFGNSFIVISFHLLYMKPTYKNVTK